MLINVMLIKKKSVVQNYDMEAEKGHRAISFEICRDFFQTVEISFELSRFL